jgi:hypothetical protein
LIRVVAIQPVTFDPETGQKCRIESALPVNPGSYVFFGGDKKNHRVIRAVLLIG